MKAPFYNQEGKITQELDLPSNIFEVPLNRDLVHQVAVAQMANRRKPIAHTKGRGEVSGGGRKPWPQKGTGRARHGSIRSPLWRHGGVVFGPRSNRVFSKKINQKMRKAAFLQVLSEKARNKLLFLLEVSSLKVPKTKEVAKLFENMFPKKKSTLLVISSAENTLMQSARNIPFVRVKTISNVNVLDLLQTTFLILSKHSFEKLV